MNADILNRAREVLVDVTEADRRRPGEFLLETEGHFALLHGLEIGIDEGKIRIIGP